MTIGVKLSDLETITDLDSTDYLIAHNDGEMEAFGLNASSVKDYIESNNEIETTIKGVTPFSFYRNDLSEKYTFADIYDKVINEDFDGLNIGDYYPFTTAYTGRDTKFVIAGINNYKSYSGGPHIDFISESEIYITSTYTNSNTNYRQVTWSDSGVTTNNGTEDCHFPYLVSDYYQKTKDIYEDFFADIIGDYVCDKHLPLPSRYSSEGTLTTSVTEEDDYDCNLGPMWMLSEKELTGSAGFSDLLDNPEVAKYHKQYPLFKALRPRALLSSSTTTTTLTTFGLINPISGSSAYACRYYYGTYPRYLSISTSTYMIVGFRIGVTTR